MANLTYFKKFGTKSDYDAYIENDPILPNVSIVGNSDIYFKDEEGPTPPPPPHDYSQDYLTFEFFGSGTLNPFSDLEYSIDNGQTWNEPAYEIDVNNGTKVLFRGNTDGNMTSSSMFYLTGDNCYFNMYGNIMSIINSTGFTTATTLQPGQGFMCMFADGYGSYGADKLLSAENLILPATALSNGCYNNMFWHCISLTGVPALPATTLAEGCYCSMFKECTSLTTAPELPATTLAAYCYDNMFNDCTGLTTAPALPVTTLAENCYSNMFVNCTSLTTAPELPATTLATWCYNSMFAGCTSLSYIKCLATNISATDCTDNWVYRVSSTGTFVKAANMEDWEEGDSGIPTGWTVQDA